MIEQNFLLGLLTGAVALIALGAYGSMRSLASRRTRGSKHLD